MLTESERRRRTAGPPRELSGARGPGWRGTTSRSTRRPVWAFAAVVAATLILVAAPAAVALPPMPPLLWSDTYLGPNTSIELVDVTSAPDGATYAAGKAWHPTEGYDAIVIRHKPTGERAWVRTYRSSAHRDEQALAVATSRAGIVAIAGRYRQSGPWGALTAAWSVSGKRLWVRRLPADANGHTGQGLDVLVSPAGDVYVAGVTTHNGNGDAFVARYSRAGKRTWLKYVGRAAGYDQGNALARDGAGNVYVAGWVMQSDGDRDHFVAKYRPDGKRLWLKKTDAGQGDDDWANAIAVRNGFVVIAGGGDKGADQTCGLVARYDTKGKLFWWWAVDKVFAPLAEYTQVGVDRYGHTIVAGWKDYFTGAGKDAFVARFEPWGDFDWEWYRRGPGDADDRATGLAVTSEGEIYAAGYYDTGAVGYDAFAVKLLPGAQITWLTTFDAGGADDGALALSLGSKGVFLAGATGSSALMLMYGKAPATP